MQINDFNADTYVAFTDISGFKEMMKGDGKKAVNALDYLNSEGFHALREESNVSAFFISDCGVLFVNNTNLSKSNKLDTILSVLSRINKALLQRDIMLTTSIAYGLFSYHNRIEFNGIQKIPIYGNAYISAYLDNENGTPRIQPGQCRIVNIDGAQDISSETHVLQRNGKHVYHYWMVNNNSEIERFESEYKDAYKMKYSGMMQALKQSNG